MSGFFVYNYQDRFGDAFDGLAAWIRAGQLKPIQDIVEGFENMPEALARLYDGRNVGVQCCSVRGEPEADRGRDALVPRGGRDALVPRGGRDALAHSSVHGKPEAEIS